MRGDHAPRVDHPLGLLVARGDVVGQPDLRAGRATAPSSSGGSARRRRPPGRRRGRRSGSKRPGCRGLQLGQRAVDHLAGVVGGAVAQGPQRDDQGGGLGRRELQRTREVVGVGDPDDPVALLALEGVEVDVDQVVGVAARQPAHEQHLEVADQLGRRDAEVGGRLVDARPSRGRGGRAPGSAAGRPGPWRSSGAGVVLMRPLPRRRPRAARPRARAARPGTRRTRRRRRPSSSSARAMPPRVQDQPVPGGARVGAGYVGLDRGGRAGAAPPPASLPDQHGDRLGRRVGRGEAARHRADVDAGRDVVGPGPAAAAGLALRRGRAGRSAPRRGRCRSPTAYQRPE